MKEKYDFSDLNLVLEHTTIALFLVDQQLRLRYLNNAAEMLLEISAKKAIGQPLPSLLLSDCGEEEIINRAYQSDFPYTERTKTVQLHNGETLTVNCTFVPIEPQEAGAEKNILIEMQQVDEFLRTSNKQLLIRQTRATADLVRGLAHEIKNPLGGLRGAAQLLEKELPDPELKEYTQIITGESDRLQKLVDTMLGPNRPPQLAETNIHELLERVCNLVLAEPEAGSLTIHRDYDPSIPDFEADADMLIQALLNIVRNAAQSLEYRGDIHITTRILRQITIGDKHHRLVCGVAICDSGPGIPEALQQQIFLPMVTGRADGTGLGLSIAQSILHRHGGVIECESSPGKTTFTLLIPLDADEQLETLPTKRTETTG